LVSRCIPPGISATTCVAAGCAACCPTTRSNKAASMPSCRSAGSYLRACARSWTFSSRGSAAMRRFQRVERIAGQRCNTRRYPMKTLPALLLAAALLAHARADDDECRFVTAPVVIQQADNRLFQYWQEPRRAVFDAPRLPDDPALLAFRRAISERIDVDHPALLTAQRGYVNGGDAINVDKVLAATVGTVRKMNCLEALLLATQAA